MESQQLHQNPHSFQNDNHFYYCVSNTLTHLFFRGKESENHMRFEIVAGNQ